MAKSTVGSVQGKERKQSAAQRCSHTRGQMSHGRKSQAQEVMRVENVGPRVQPH